MGLGLYQQSSETPRNTTKLLILVISGRSRVWLRIQSKHVWGGERDYTGLFRLNLVLTTLTEVHAAEL